MSISFLDSTAASTFANATKRVIASTRVKDLNKPSRPPLSPWRSSSQGSRSSLGKTTQASRKSKTLTITKARHQVSMQGQAASSLPAVTELSDEELIDQEAVPSLVQDAQVWASLHGLVVGDRAIEGSGTCPGTGMVHAPISLLPTPFPRSLFAQAVELSPLFNELMDRVSEDKDFIVECLASARKTDSFTAGLLDVLEKVTAEGLKDNVRLGLHRSDYMLDKATGDLLQIEHNNISSSFGGLGTLVSDMHSYLVGRAGDKCQLEAANVPKNVAATALAEGLALGWKEYGDASAVVLTVVQPTERNMYDQLWHAHHLWQSHGIKTIRKTLAELDAHATLGEDRSLIVDGTPVGVVYFRAGYGPMDYPSDAEWRGRLLIERSRAVKCPNISYHLSGTKKIQQELARPGVVERFASAEDAACLRRCFAGLWSLEGEGAEAIIAEAKADPDRFVLKPQREGGGNNIYGADVPPMLEKLQKTGGLGGYILMQRIWPPIKKSILLRGGQWSAEETLSELGIYGVYLRNGDKVLANKAAGHLLRTKTASSDEGGVAAGFAVIDSPYLTD